ncbi:SDR family oxidoreductase [Planctomicrobium sp. SH664]|uniref:SDR family oxidoreductase n=1 Tax=Planctomicrobium sp. SH664 TaxID=3448125 RepID=UPI003F5B65F4
MQKMFEGQVVFITGGSSGIGKETAAAFAQAGACVAICGRSTDELNQVAEELEDDCDLLTLTLDVSHENEMQAGVDKIMKRWGRLDFVFANAGINGVWAPIDDLTAEEWDQTVNVNLRGTFLTIRSCTPHLRRQGGAITINASVNGTRMFSNTGATAYAATKAAQVALGKMLAVELAGDGIRVNIICPGAIQTEIEESTERRNLQKFERRVEFPEGAVPLTNGAPGTAAEVADLVLFLSSPRARHITGTEIWIDGAQSLLQG